MNFLYVLLKNICPEFLDKSTKQFALYKHRYESRKSLLKLDDDRLKDIGISRSEAEAEAKKPFWKGENLEIKQRGATKAKNPLRKA